jgi:hypothetical protein
MLRAVRRICPHEILANFGTTRRVVSGHERRFQRAAHLSHTASPPTVDSCVDWRIGRQSCNTVFRLLNLEDLTVYKSTTAL